MKSIWYKIGSQAGEKRKLRVDDRSERKKRGSLFLGVLVFMIAFAASLPSFADEMESRDMVGAAQEGIRTFLRDVPLPQLQRLGFNSREEADRATLGEGFQIHAIWEFIHLRKDSKLEDLKPLAIPLDSWQFMVLSSGEPKAMLTVDRIDHQWKAVSLGGSNLSRALREVAKKYPPSLGFKGKILRMYKLDADFLEMTRRGEDIGIVTLPSAKRAMGFEKTEDDPQEGRKVPVPGFVSGVDAKKQLPVEEVFQEQSQWCWAASGQAILTYYGKSISQCELVELARQKNVWGDDRCCRWPNSKSCNQPNRMIIFNGSLQRIIENWGISGYGSIAPLTWSSVVAELDSGRPFLMGWQWKGGGAHVMVGYGYEKKGEFVHYMDPWYGYTKSLYRWIVDSFDHQWGQTLLIAKTLQPPYPAPRKEN